LRLDLFLSPPIASKSAYEEIRHGATPTYLYGRFGLGDTYRLPYDMSLSGLLRLQATTTPLLPSEQFGLGGYDTVRGYLERDYLADSALCANIEIRSPQVHSLLFLAFADFASGWNFQKGPGEASAATLASLGAGCRLNFRSYLSGRLDYGFRLAQIPQSPHRLGRLHFSITAAY
jgi:hemolysin activation/secretion protein